MTPDAVMRSLQPRPRIGQMRIRTSSSTDVAVLTLSGRLDVESCSALREACADVLRAGCRQIVLNMLGVSGIDAAGLGELVGAVTRVRQAGGELIMVLNDPAVREVLVRTHLIGLFVIVTNEAEALARVDPALAR